MRVAHGRSPAGQVLTMDAGVEVQFSGSTSQFTVQGTLIARGNAASYIKFTGRANVPNTTSGPINFEASSQNAILQYVIVDALGYNPGGGSIAVIAVKTSSIRILNYIIQNLGGIPLSVQPFSSYVI